MHTFIYNYLLYYFIVILLKYSLIIGQYKFNKNQYCAQ